MDSVANIILYFVVAICIAVFSVMTVTSRKILRAATYLLFVLIGTAVFYFQLGYQFLGAVQIAVYAGGIMVLFVFSILLTGRPDEKTPLARVASSRSRDRCVCQRTCAVASRYVLYASDRWPVTLSVHRIGQAYRYGDNRQRVCRY